MSTNVISQALIIGSVNAAVYWTDNSIKAMRLDEQGNYSDCSYHVRLLLDCPAEKRLLVNIDQQQLQEAILFFGKNQQLLNCLLTGMDKDVSDKLRYQNLVLANEALQGGYAEFAINRLLSCPLPDTADLEGAIILADDLIACKSLYQQLSLLRAYSAPVGRILQDLLYFEFEALEANDEIYRALMDAGVLRKAITCLDFGNYSAIRELALEYAKDEALLALCPKLDLILERFWIKISDYYQLNFTLLTKADDWAYAVDLSLERPVMIEAAFNRFTALQRLYYASDGVTSHQFEKPEVMPQVTQAGIREYSAVKIPKESESIAVQNNFQFKIGQNQPVSFSDE